MSDFKTKFAAAKAQRKSAAPTREQLKALRAQKATTPAVRLHEGTSAQDFRAECIAKYQSLQSTVQQTTALPAPQLDQAEQAADTNGHLARPPQPAESVLPSGFFDQTEEPSEHQVKQQSSAAMTEANVADTEPADKADVLANGASAVNSSAAALPDGFFDAGSFSTPVVDVTPGSAPVQMQSTSSEVLPGSRLREASNSDAAANQNRPIPSVGPLPKDFFADKSAGAKASGLPVPKKQTPEEQIAEFNKAVANDVLAAEEAEEVEATGFAADRAAREAFEQQQHIDAVERLRQKAAAARKRNAQEASAAAPDKDCAHLQAGEETQREKKQRRKRRKHAMDVFVDSDSSSSESGTDDNEAIDWRAKAL